jgi:hypothetical protein
MRGVRVVVSLDFGTHSSGHGWCDINERNNDPARRYIELRDQWEGQPTPYPKVLTALLLDRDGVVVDWGYQAQRRWREQQVGGVDRGWRLPRWFKLGLLRHSDPLGALARPAAALDRNTATEELIAAYLEKLFGSVLTNLALHGYHRDEIRVCLTVPAQWSDRQKQVMRKAAVAAGIPHWNDRLILALEPEAAAHHARVSGVKRYVETGEPAPSLTEPGQRFMVVDCGGGTVDLTAYRNSDDHAMEEITRASGEALGAQCLTAAFIEQVLIKRLGGVEEYNRLQRVCPLEMDELIARWEQEKQHVNANPAAPVVLPLTAPLPHRFSRAARRSLKEQQDGDSNRVIITPNELRDIFEQVVPRISDLIGRQLTEMHELDGPAEEKELILLAGGFAASPYLQKRLHEELGDRADLLVLPDPASAVLRGAIHFAYSPETRARRSRFTYGIESAMTFEEGVDPEALKTYNAWGEPRCVDRFAIYVTSGQSVPSGQEITHTYHPLYGDQTDIDIDIYTCDRAVPRYVSDQGCRRIGHVRIDLSEVMHLDILQRGIRVTMRFGETEIRAKVTVEKTGKELNHTVEFDEE